MAKTRYKKSYCDEVMAYFLKFIDMRDEHPKEDGEKNTQGMISITIEDGKARTNTKPCNGYPTLTKFAIKIGVTPRTITNWRQKYPEFDEACEFADQIQDDILSERALFGDVDGRVAMKIRELKANARREESNGAERKITLVIESDGENEIPIQKWTGEVNEDTGYKV